MGKIKLWNKFKYGLGAMAHWQKPFKQLRPDESKHSIDELQPSPFSFFGRQLLIVESQ